MLDALTTRSNPDASGGKCELCGNSNALSVFHVPPHEDRNVDHAVLVCDICEPQLDDSASLDGTHWFCLQEAIWSQHAAVQVVSYRLLRRLTEHGWAQELLAQAYLDETTMAWALLGVADDGPPTVDSNGTRLAAGDSVTLIKDLNVKGAGFTAKRGTLVKNIRLTDNPEHVDGKVNGMAIVLKACFLKKA